MRYSPKPIEDYGRTIDGKFIGPSTSHVLKGDAERWNLAFLSFDYAARPVPPDAQFTSLVLKTVATRLDTGEIDVTERKVLVRSLLRMPAPQFVKVIEHHSILPQLPLFKAMGSAWLATIRARSRICATYDDEPGVDDVESVADAARLLSLISARR